MESGRIGGPTVEETFRELIELATEYQQLVAMNASGGMFGDRIAELDRLMYEAWNRKTSAGESVAELVAKLNSVPRR